MLCFPNFTENYVNTITCVAFCTPHRITDVLQTDTTFAHGPLSGSMFCVGSADSPVQKLVLAQSSYVIRLGPVTSQRLSVSSSGRASAPHVESTRNRDRRRAAPNLWAQGRGTASDHQAEVIRAFNLSRRLRAPCDSVLQYTPVACPNCIHWV